MCARVCVLTRCILKIISKQTSQRWSWRQCAFRLISLRRNRFDIDPETVFCAQDQLGNFGGLFLLINSQQEIPQHHGDACPHLVHGKVLADTVPEKEQIETRL